MQQSLIFVLKTRSERYDFSCHPAYWDYRLGVLREQIQIKQKGGSS